MGLVVKEPSMEQHLLQIRANTFIRDRVEVLPPHQPRMALRDRQLRLVPYVCDCNGMQWRPSSRLAAEQMDTAKLEWALRDLPGKPSWQI